LFILFLFNLLIQATDNDGSNWRVASIKNKHKNILLSYIYIYIYVAFVVQYIKLGTHLECLFFKYITFINQDIMLYSGNCLQLGQDILRLGENKKKKKYRVTGYMNKK
jgi:hypothetical protein